MVGGMQLSGMSTIVVTPPAAAARVAVANPSHSVRPGSFTCTWLSTRPGQQYLVVAEVHHLRCAQVRVERFDRDDPPVRDSHASSNLSGRGDHTRSAEYEV